MCLLSNGPYVIIAKDPTLSLERKIIKQLMDLRHRDILPKNMYYRLRPSGSQTPLFYGLPKIHKENIPLRPIVSACGSVTYKVTKLLAQTLEPLCGNTVHHVKNSTDFASSVLNTRVTRNEVMASFDVVSPFTSVPLNEVLKLTNDRLLADSTLEERSTIPVIDIMRLLEFCLRNTYFQFRGTIYEQSEGLAMGSPVSPVLANLYMEEFEQIALRSNNAPRLWKRYVDDTFMIIRSRFLSRFLQHLNSIRPGVICFTHEIEENNTLPFLEVLVMRADDGSLNTSIHRKLTHTDQLLNFYSNHPVSNKRSVVSTLSKRGNLIPSTITAKKQEESHLRAVFAANNYTKDFVLQTILQSTSDNKKHRSETPEMTVPIPYVKGTSENIRRILGEVDIRTVFKTTNTLRQLLSYPKDRIPLQKRSGVVYSIPCKDCPSVYIGETGLWLSTRLQQHQEATRKGETDKSAVAKHVWDMSHNMDWSNTTVMDCDPQSLPRKAIHIRNSKGHSLINRDCGLEVSYMWDTLLEKTTSSNP